MPDEPTDPALLARLRAFGARLRALRKEAGMTQAQVAAEAGLSRVFFLRVEAGQLNISVANVFAIADALGVEVAELFTDLDPRRTTEPDPSDRR